MFYIREVCAKLKERISKKESKKRAIKANPEEQTKKS
jgi:hypothetical protein